MHIGNCTGCARRRAKMKQGLGWVTEAAGALISAFGNQGGGGGDSGAMMPSNTNTVSPNIQVSPQISPVFQQQFQPTNSAATAGTSQNLPGIGFPSGGNPLPSVPGGNIPMPSTSGIVSPWAKYVPWLVGGTVALFAIKAFTEKRGRNAN